ncbi:AAA family ATPase [bacterium]|nr:AAA family ATPase [bacterium]
MAADMAEALGTPPRRCAALLRLADVAPAPVDWLWPGRIPRGMVTFVDGDPAAGKTTIALDLAARVSTGAAWPCGAAGGEPGAVLYLTAEDALAQTIRPRLDAAGADCARVYTLDAEAHGGVTMQDADILADALERTGAVLLVVDPLTAYLGAGVDMHRGEQTRPVLRRIGALAERHGCAVVIVRHLRKSGTDRALYRGLGSVDLAGVARSVLLAGVDPSDADQRALAHIKLSVGPHAPTLGYAIESVRVPLSDGRCADVGRVRWTGPSDLTADALLAAAPDADQRSELAEAVDWLRERLAEGQAVSRAVEREAGGAGISARTLRRARSVLGVQSRRTGLPGRRGGGEWVMALPGCAVADADEETGVIA